MSEPQPPGEQELADAEITEHEATVGVCDDGTFNIVLMEDEKIVAEGLRRDDITEVAWAIRDKMDVHLPTCSVVKNGDDDGCVIWNKRSGRTVRFRRSQATNLASHISILVGDEALGVRSFPIHHASAAAAAEVIVKPKATLFLHATEDHEDVLQVFIASDSSAFDPVFLCTITPSTHPLSPHFSDEDVKRGAFPLHVGPSGPIYKDKDGDA